MKKIIFIICCFVLMGCGHGSGGKLTEPASYNGWVVVKVDNIAAFQMPPMMEIQTEEYRKLSHDPNVHLAEGNLNCQQKGLNAMNEFGRSHYARILFRTGPVKDKFPAYGQPLGFTDKDIKEFDAYLQKLNTEQLKKLQIQIIKWEPIKKDFVNGAECLHAYYTRQLKDKPVVGVDSYYFFNNDKLHTLIISSRLKENNFWHAPNQDLRNVVKTLKITPR